MSKDLKNKLMRLGTTNPELRPHLRPVLDSLKTRVASDSFRPSISWYIDGNWADFVNYDGDLSSREVKDMAYLYQEALEKAFARAYPEAEVEIMVDLRTSGHRNSADGLRLNQVSDLANKTLERLATRHGWW